MGDLVSLGFRVSGQGDLVSRLIMWIIWVSIWVIGVDYKMNVWRCAVCDQFVICSYT